MARRLNTRFLTILLLILVGTVAAALLAQRFLIHEQPDRYIALGRQAMKDRSWQDAANDFAKAAKLDPHDPQTPMMLGAALAKMAGLHQTYVGLLESEERSPNLDTAKAIAKALGLSLAEMIAEAERLCRKRR